MRLKVNPVVKVEILEPFPDEVDVTNLGLFENPWLQLSEFRKPFDCAHLPEGPLGHFLKSLDRP